MAIEFNLSLAFRRHPITSPSPIDLRRKVEQGLCKKADNQKWCLLMSRRVSRRSVVRSVMLKQPVILKRPVTLKQPVMLKRPCAEAAKSKDFDCQTVVTCRCLNVGSNFALIWQKLKLAKAGLAKTGLAKAVSGCICTVCICTVNAIACDSLCRHR